MDSLSRYKYQSTFIYVFKHMPQIHVVLESFWRSLFTIGRIENVKTEVP